MAFTYYSGFTFYAQPAETFGFEMMGAIDPWGLLTHGLIWHCPLIWSQTFPNVTTVWTSSDSPITTTWVSSDAVITTTWTPLDGSGGAYGEC